MLGVTVFSGTEIFGIGSLGRSFSPSSRRQRVSLRICLSPEDCGTTPNPMLATVRSSRDTVLNLRPLRWLSHEGFHQVPTKRVPTNTGIGSKIFAFLLSGMPSG